MFVIGTVSSGEVNYQGSSTNTLVIAKATATVTLGRFVASLQRHGADRDCINFADEPDGDCHL